MVHRLPAEKLKKCLQLLTLNVCQLIPNLLFLIIDYLFVYELFIIYELRWACA